MVGVDSTAETWKSVVGQEGIYEVSDLGRVRRLVSRYNQNGIRVLKPWKNGNGYRQVTLAKKPKRVHPYVHLLVWRALVGPIPEGMEVNHKDLNKDNNRLDNLELLTKVQNVRHATENGAQKPRRGMLNGRCKLTDDQIEEILTALPPGQNCRNFEVNGSALAARMGVSPSLIALVRNGKVFRTKHLRAG